MIEVTRLNGTKFMINALLIELIEEAPDTHITLTTGKKFVVLEKAHHLASLIADFHRSIGVYNASLKSGNSEDSTS